MPTNETQPDATSNRDDEADLLSEGELLPGLAAAYTSEQQQTPGVLLARIAKPGDVVAGRYRLIEMIGEGGMSTVWYAEQWSPVKRKVALKLIKPGMDSRTVIARFEAERQALAMMDHPNIAQVLDGGMTEWGYPFFVMELIRGTSITRFCDERKLNLKQRLELLIPVCRAIQHAHQKGIIHRDIKPTNVLVALFDGAPIPKVIDFGVAKAIGGALDEFSVHTCFGAVVGTPEYMSPEQAVLNNLDVDTRTDVYSLGVLAYELLAGSTPFRRDDLLERGSQEIMRVIREVEPPKPSVKLSTSKARATIAELRGMDFRSLSQSLDGDLDRILMKSLEKDRARRYDSADAMARDLNRYLNNEPIEAREPSALYLLTKWAARYRWQAMALVALFLTMLLGAIGTSFGLIRSERLRAKIEQAQRQTELLAAQEREAKLAAITQRELAVKAEELALTSYRESTNEAIEKLIGSKKSLTTPEREYLDNALRRWLEFAERIGDDERSERVRAEAFDRVSIIREILGEALSAIEDRRKAIAAWDRLINLCPAKHEYRNERAHSRRNLAILLEDNEGLTEAKQIYETTLAEQQELVEQHPDNVAYIEELAQQIERQSGILGQLGQQQKSTELLKQALDLQRQIIQRQPDRLDYQYALAVCMYNLSRQLMAIGEGDQEATLRESHSIYNRLIEQKPYEVTYKIAATQCALVLANLLSVKNRLDEAEDLYRHGIVSLEELVRQYPSVIEYRLRLALAHNYLSYFLRQHRTQIDEALREMKLSNAIYQQLAVSFPESKNRKALASSQNSLGAMLTFAGQFEEARQQFLQSFQTCLELVAEEPEASSPSVAAAVACIKLAEVSNETADWEAAVTWSSQCIEILRPVLNRERRDIDTRELLIDAHRTHALAIERLGGKPKEDWDRIFELLPQTDSSRSKYCYARALVESHQALAALDMLDQMLPASPSSKQSSQYSPVDYFNFACLFAQLSQEPEVSAEQLLDRALTALGQAVKLGFSDARFARTHWVLEPLRARREFHVLLDEMRTHTK